MKLQTPHDIIIKPLVTEKVMKGAEQARTYGFRVSGQANKPEIKKAIESIFSVKVEKVRTLNLKGKPKRYRMMMGTKPGWKKAMVTLKEGHRIDVI